MVWSLLLLAFASAVGFAALTALMPREPAFRRLLWAPAFGFGIATLAVFALSRAGAPVGSVAVPLVVAGILCFAGIVAWRRPRISLRRLAAFGAIVVVVYAANAVPLARLGSAWLGYVNGDMLFYCEGADNLIRHGTGDLPSGAELDARDELSRTTSSLYAFVGVREGSELLLAFASALERVHPDEAFMGLEIALIAALATAVGALIARSARRRFAATVAGAAAGALPLVAYSAFNGLMPQLIGSALLAVAYGICGDRLFVVRRSLGTAVAGGIAIAALLVIYPEMAPFLFVALIVRAAIARRIPRALGTAAAAVVVVLNLYLPVPMAYAVRALSSRGAVALTPHVGAAGAGAGATQAHFGFPYMLEPIGQANLWGFAALAPSPSDPRTQIGIVLGLIASLVTIVLLVRRRREPVTALVGVLSAVLLVLMLRSSDFGSFKAALYLEPFLAAFLATFGRRGLVAAVWVLAALPVQLYYVDRSYGELEREGNHYVSVAGASSSRLPERLERAVRGAPAALVTSDDRDVRHLAVLRARGTPLFEAQGRRIPADFVNPLDHVRTTVDGVPVSPERYVADVLRPRADQGPDQSISIGGRVADFRSAPEVAFAERRRGLRVVPDDPDHSVLNRSGDGATADMLVDMGSSLGSYGDHGLYPVERDPYRPGGTMSASSRYGVFAVLAPTARMRLRLDLASAFVGNGAAPLPPARIITADGVLPLDIVGGGSARVESPPFRPLERNHRAFVVLDFGVDPPKEVAEPRRGLWLLWGRRIAYDNRDVVTYVRDLSAVPDGRAHAAPSALRRFPEDLADPALRFSGVYDDGWSSRDFHVTLARRPDDRVLHVRVDVPTAVRSSRGTSNACVVTLDGKAVARFAAPPGSYDEQILIPDDGTGARRVGLHFDRGVRLGPRDKREAAALVREIAFAPQ